VALARALVAEPKVILFDEPLSNLDAKLREETRKELRTFLSELAITAVYVTHDRIEALALSDQIGVMRSGHIIEIGEPKKIYFDSEHQFVADFIGRSNLLPVTIENQGESYTEVVSSIGNVLCARKEFPEDAEITLCIRPEFVDLIEPGEKETLQNVFTGIMKTMVFVGEVYESEIQIGDQLIMVKVDPDSNVQEGDEVVVAIDPDHCLLVSR